MKRWLIMAMLAVAPAAYSADVFVGGHGGLLGLGAEAGADFGKVRVRGQVNRFDVSESNSYDGASYDVDLDLDTTGVLVDFAPFGGRFFLTAGLYDNGIAISGVSEALSVQVGNSVLVNEKVFIDVAFDDTSPYAGLGWRFFNGGGNSGLGLSLELGAFMNGSPDVNITTSDSAFNQNNQDDIAAEEANIEDDIDQADMLPVAKLGVSWYF